MMLSGKVVVVTGGGNGIGRATALGMAAAGAKIVVNDYGVSLQGAGPNSGPGEETAALIRSKGGEATSIFETVATMEGGKRIIDTALDAYGRIDVLICAAGILRRANIFDSTEEDWDKTINTHLKGCFATVQPAAIRMREQKSGSIILFTSTGGLEGSPLQVAYGAAKEGIVGLMRGVALSLAPDVTCNAISPSANTRLTQRSSTTPEEIVPLITYLASDASKHVTGQVIRCQGKRISLFPQPRYFRSMHSETDWTAERIAASFDAALGVDPLVRYERFVGKIEPGNSAKGAAIG